MEIVNTFPNWAYLLCFIASGLIAYFFYRRDKRLEEFSRISLAFLTLFRFLSLGVLAVLLLSPLLKYLSKTVEEPIIIIAQDNSSSMVSGKDSAFIKVEFQEKIKELSTALQSEYRLESFAFDEKAFQNEEKPNFNGKVTNYEALLDEIESRYVNQNVGGLILISDGIYNQGSQPNYLTKKFDFPIYTVATGDTTAYKDASIVKLRNNKISFLGNEFPLEIDLRIKEANAENLSLRVVGEEGEVYKTTITANSDDYLETLKINLEANQIGLQQYKVIISSLAKERNVQNNARNFYIDVLDGRQKVALLATSPHPDIAALKRSIEKNENYELTTSLWKNFKEDFNQYDLVIMHQPIGSKEVALDQKIRQLLKSKAPLLLIGGGWRTMGIQFGIKALNASRRTKVQEQAFPLLNSNFTLFTVSEALAKQLNNFPPLEVERSKLNTTLGNTVLLNQKIGAVNTKYPMLEFFEKDGRKLGRWYAENIWKWGINDFSENKSHERFNELTAKIVQYLAVKADRSFFRVSSNNEYYENEVISFDAQLFNQSYELINNAVVSLQLKDEEGKEYNFSFNTAGNAYQLQIPSLPHGKYSYSATSSFNGKQLEEKGKILVKELKLEQLESVADHNLLYQLSEKTAGQMVYPNQLNELLNLINNREDIAAVSYQSEEVEDIINLEWIFFLVMAFLSIEWFIRKWGGAY